MNTPGAKSGAVEGVGGTDSVGTAGRVCVGQIAGAQGVRGAVVITSFTDVPQDLCAYGPLTDETGRRRFELQGGLKPHKKGFVCHLSGVETREQAEALKGARLYVPRDRLPRTDEEEWYHADLIGLAVVDQTGEEIGTVAGVHDFGAGDLLEIRIEGRATTELLTFTKDNVPVVSIARRRVVIDPPEGWPE